METLSIVVPCYNEEETVEIFFEETTKVCDRLGMKYEIIYVNDGSKDNTIEKLKALYERNSDIVKVIDFSRNFGKEGALLAGLELASGDYITVMDADLQDPPAFIPQMIEMIKIKELDVVGTRRVSRKGEPKIRSFFARQFYKFINMFTEVEIVDGARDFRMMKKEVVDSILQLREHNRFSKGLFVWVGYKTEYLEYENVERVAGETSWSFKKLFLYAIEGIIAFTTMPLRIATVFGVITSLIAVIMAIFVFVRTLVFKDPVAGWPSMAIMIMLFSGIQIAFMGIIGEYLAKTYIEVKNRPNYIVKKCYMNKRGF